MENVDNLDVDIHDKESLIEIEVEEPMNSYDLGIPSFVNEHLIKVREEGIEDIQLMCLI